MPSKALPDGIQVAKIDLTSSLPSTCFLSSQSQVLLCWRTCFPKGWGCLFQAKLLHRFLNWKLWLPPDRFGFLMHKTHLANNLSVDILIPHCLLWGLSNGEGVCVNEHVWNLRIHCIYSSLLIRYLLFFFLDGPDSQCFQPYRQYDLCHNYLTHLL